MSILEARKLQVYLKSTPALSSEPKPVYVPVGLL